MVRKRRRQKELAATGPGQKKPDFADLYNNQEQPRVEIRKDSMPLDVGLEEATIYTQKDEAHGAPQALNKFGRRGLVMVGRVFDQFEKTGNEISNPVGRINDQIEIRNYQPVEYGTYEMLALMGTKDPQTKENQLYTAELGFPYAIELNMVINAAAAVRFPPAGIIFNNPVERLEIVNLQPLSCVINIDADALVLAANVAPTGQRGFTVEAGSARSIPIRAHSFISVIADAGWVAGQSVRITVMGRKPIVSQQGGRQLPNLIGTRAAALGWQIGLRRDLEKLERRP